MKKLYCYLLILLICSCTNQSPTSESIQTNNHLQHNTEVTSLVLLGTLQDGGSPHIGCQKSCCAPLFDHPDPNRQVIALGLYDQATDKKYLFEATPDLPRQVKALKNYGQPSDRELPDGIFLTHAHMGHYAGLMYLGKEAMDAQKVPVFVMPRMKTYLTNNGPWSQLVTRQNILLQEMENERSIPLSEDIQVTPFLVPHRDEYSETVGYRIEGPHKKALFIPDIDKWEKWEKDILTEIKQVDYAFLDATFYSGAEINTRDISQIPHPFISESLEKFASLSTEERQKVIFIHFNHTNPVLDTTSAATAQVVEAGFRIGKINDIFPL